LQADASIFKAHDGWSNLMYRSQFHESRVLEAMSSPAEQELDQDKKRFNLPFFTRARNGNQIIQPSSRNALKTL